MHSRCFLILFLLTAHLALAQPVRYSFINYNTSQGLPDNNVQSLLQDSRGFLWIGTSEGLSRFDGKTFKNFFMNANDTVLKANDFAGLYEYKPGHLVMNNYSYVICFNTYTEQFYKPDLPRIVSGTIMQQPGQKGFSLSGINKAYLLNPDLTIADSIPNPPVAGNYTHLAPIVLKGEKNVLVQYGRDFFFYDLHTKQYEPLNLNLAPGRLLTTPTLRYYDTVRHEILFSDYIMGNYLYSLQTKQVVPMTRTTPPGIYLPGFVYQVLPRASGELWIATDRGVNVLNYQKQTAVHIEQEPGKAGSLISNYCFAITADREGNIWIGTMAGISKLSAASQSIRSWTDALSTSPGTGLMSVVKGPDNHIYSSVYLGKAFDIDPVKGTATVWNHPRNTGNWNLFVRGNEIIRTGTGNTLLAYNTSTKKFYELDFLKPYYPNVELIVLGFVHSNGDEWYCANRGGGFVRKLAGSNQFKTYRKDDGINHFSNGYYTSYTEDRNGDLWFGVNKTSYLAHWNRAKDQFDELNFNSLPGMERKVFTGINALTTDAAGHIWVGFNGSGVLEYDPVQQSAHLFTIGDGLPTNFISGLRFDEAGRLWLNTFKGLTCYIPAEKKFLVFKKEDGLPDDYFSDYCITYDTATHTLWTGSSTSLMAIQPEQLLAKSREFFPLYVDELYVNNTRWLYAENNTIRLRSFQNNLQFHYTGVDLSKGKDIEYSYKLEGAEKEWNFTGSNQTASYTSLKPGNYTFMVRARHRGDNRWNEINTPVSIHIATPWNKTTGFRIGVVLLISFILWQFIRAWFRRRLERQRVLLEKQQAVERERTRIATDMHDDFGASLSRIKFLSEKLQLLNPADPAEKTDLEKISQYSDEMAEKMNEIVWALNQRYDSLGDLLSFCRSYASEYLQDKNIRLQFTGEAEGEEKVQGEVRRNIFLVMKEALRNIVKHAGASQVDIRFSRLQEGIEFQIADNGRGIDLANIRPFANGLENMKKRMQDIGGELRIENRGGTLLTLYVPLNQLLG